MNIENQSGETLRLELATRIEKIIFLEKMLRDTREEARAIQAVLVNPNDDRRMKPDEGIPTKYGVLKRIAVKKGRAWVVTDEVDKSAGELPEELQPKKDKRVVIEHLSDLSTGLQAELTLLSESGDEAPVKMTDKAKYPTVAALRKEFGQDTRFVGDPPKEHLVVLVKGEGEDALQVWIEGLA